jgi:hypothetical protein
MAKTLTVIVAVVVIIAVVAAAGAFVLLKDEQEKVTFLIEDQNGVYFWIEGSGDTAFDAFKNSLSSYPEETLVLNDYGIDSLFGVATTEDDGNYTWWAQYSWDGGWKVNEVGMKEIKSADVEYILVIYNSGESTLNGVPTPDKAKVWDGSKDGTVFTIASPSGLYFQVNGSSSESVMAAFTGACDKYNIPVQTSDHPTYGTSLNSVFGLAMEETTPGNWSWWNQILVKDGAWESASPGMASQKCDDNPRFLLAYGDGAIPDIPVKV